jgi:hypothetical protein
MQQTKLSVIDFAPRIKKVFLSHGDEPFALLATDNRPNPNVILRVTEDGRRPTLSFFSHDKEMHHAIIRDADSYFAGSIAEDSYFHGHTQKRLRNLG